MNKSITKFQEVITALINTGTTGMTYAEIGKLSKRVGANVATNFFMKKMGWFRIANGKQDSKKPNIVLIDSIALHKPAIAAVKLYEFSKKYQKEYHLEKMKEKKKLSKHPLTQEADSTVSKVSLKEFNEDFAINYLKERGYKILKPVTKFEEVI